MEWGLVKPREVIVKTYVVCPTTSNAADYQLTWQATAYYGYDLKETKYEISRPDPTKPDDVVISVNTPGVQLLDDKAIISTSGFFKLNNRLLILRSTGARRKASKESTRLTFWPSLRVGNAQAKFQLGLVG